MPHFPCPLGGITLRHMFYTFPRISPGYWDPVAHCGGLINNLSVTLCLPCLAAPCLYQSISHFSNKLVSLDACVRVCHRANLNKSQLWIAVMCTKKRAPLSGGVFWCKHYNYGGGTFFYTRGQYPKTTGRTLSLIKTAINFKEARGKKIVDTVYISL